MDKNKHCFFGRKGGVSREKYSSLNVNTKSGDDKNIIAQNLQIVADKMGLKKENLVLLSQGVSNVAVVVDEASQDKIEADGVVSSKEGIGLCIRTADCAPVLLEDRQNSIVGAAHAGWRGAFKGILENVVKLMIEKGAKKENICAAIGPCIMQKSYEVDSNFYNQFIDQNKINEKYFTDGKTKGFFYFDLQNYCYDRLKNIGIDNIEMSNLDTYALENEYFSFRRFTHMGLSGKAKDFPTHISVIML